jgi:hypothetical protein
MIPLIEPATVVLNNAASGILAIDLPSCDAVSGEFIYVSVSYEVANPTITLMHNGPYGAFNSLTKQHDATDVKGHQEFWLQATVDFSGLIIKARFSTGVGFVAIWRQRRKPRGNISLVGEGTPGSATASATLTIPNVTGSKLHLAAFKAFGSCTLTNTVSGPWPYGIMENASRSHHIFSSETPFSGTLTPATGALSSAQNWLCTAASFADDGSVPGATVVPAWYTNATDRTVIKIPGATVLAAGLDASNGGDRETASVFTFWSGGALCPNGLYVGTEQRNGPHLVVSGQGHTTAGNEVLALGPLNADYPGWSRLRDNTVPVPTNVEFDGSNNPVAIHSYSTLTYTDASGNNRFLSMGGIARYSDASNINVPFWFDLNQSAPNITSPWGKSAVTIGGWYWVVWDSGTAKFWGTAVGDLTAIRSYDPAADTYSNSYGAKTVPSYSTPVIAACDQTNGLILYSVNGNTFSMFRPSLAASTDFYTPTTTGTAPSTASAVIWDAVGKRFVVFVSATPNVLSILTPPQTNPYSGGNAWTWTQEAYGGQTIDAAQANGTYGRFQYLSAQQMQGYVLVNSYNSAAYLFVRKPVSSSALDFGPDNRPKKKSRSSGMSWGLKASEWW